MIPFPVQDAQILEFIRGVIIDHLQILPIIQQYAIAISKRIEIRIDKCRTAVFGLYHGHIRFSGFYGLKYSVQIPFTGNGRNIYVIFLQNILSENYAPLIEHGTVHRGLIQYAIDCARIQIVSQAFLDPLSILINQPVHRIQCPLCGKRGYIFSPNQGKIDLLGSGHHQVHLIIIGTYGIYLQLQVDPKLIHHIFPDFFGHHILICLNTA